ncbi:MAG TPA: diguanylate cyclase [Desulfosporosinus sp.]|nr:diguanylate cyclase [Desulfosporosinus sp.]
MVLLFFDIDNLKMINDTFGHLEGDKAIKKATQTLRATFCELDIITRLGGDEFVVLALDIKQGRTPILLHRLDQIMREYIKPDYSA